MCYIHIYIQQILFSLKKEGNSDTYYHIDEPWGHYAKWNKSVSPLQKVTYVWVHLYDKVGWPLPGAGGWENGKLFNEYRVSLLWDE